MQVTYIKESRASMGRFNDDKTGLVDAGWNRELDTGGAAYWGRRSVWYMSEVSEGGADGGGEGWELEREGWMPSCLQDVFTLHFTCVHRKHHNHMFNLHRFQVIEVHV